MISSTAAGSKQQAASSKQLACSKKQASMQLMSSRNIKQ
jgi:hypothetical protein